MAGPGFGSMSGYTIPMQSLAYFMLGVSELPPCPFGLEFGSNPGQMSYWDYGARVNCGLSLIEFRETKNPFVLPGFSSITGTYGTDVLSGGLYNNDQNINIDFVGSSSVGGGLVFYDVFLCSSSRSSNPSSSTSNSVEFELFGGFMFDEQFGVINTVTGEIKIPATKKCRAAMKKRPIVIRGKRIKDPIFTHQRTTTTDFGVFISQLWDALGSQGQEPGGTNTIETATGATIEIAEDLLQSTEIYRVSERSAKQRIAKTTSTEQVVGGVWFRFDMVVIDQLSTNDGVIVDGTFTMLERNRRKPKAKEQKGTDPNYRGQGKDISDAPGISTLNIEAEKIDRVCMTAVTTRCRQKFPLPFFGSALALPLDSIQGTLMNSVFWTNLGFLTRECKRPRNSNGRNILKWAVDDSGGSNGADKAVEESNDGEVFAHEYNEDCTDVCESIDEQLVLVALKMQLFCASVSNAKESQKLISMSAAHAMCQSADLATYVVGVLSGDTDAMHEMATMAAHVGTAQKEYTADSDSASKEDSKGVTKRSRKDDEDGGEAKRLQVKPGGKKGVPILKLANDEAASPLAIRGDGKSDQSLLKMETSKDKAMDEEQSPEKYAPYVPTKTSYESEGYKTNSKTCATKPFVLKPVVPQVFVCYTPPPPPPPPPPPKPSKCPPPQKWKGYTKHKVNTEFYHRVNWVAEQMAESVQCKKELLVIENVLLDPVVDEQYKNSEWVLANKKCAQVNDKGLHLCDTGWTCVDGEKTWGENDAAAELWTKSYTDGLINIVSNSFDPTSEKKGPPKHGKPGMGPHKKNPKDDNKRSRRQVGSARTRRVLGAVPPAQRLNELTTSKAKRNPPLFRETYVGQALSPPACNGLHDFNEYKGSKKDDPKHDATCSDTCGASVDFRKSTAVTPVYFLLLVVLVGGAARMIYMTPMTPVDDDQTMLVRAIGGVSAVCFVLVLAALALFHAIDDKSCQDHMTADAAYKLLGKTAWLWNTHFTTQQIMWPTYVAYLCLIYGIFVSAALVLRPTKRALVAVVSTTPLVLLTAGEVWVAIGTYGSMMFHRAQNPNVELVRWVLDSVTIARYEEARIDSTTPDHIAVDDKLEHGAVLFLVASAIMLLGVFVGLALQTYYAPGTKSAPTATTNPMMQRFLYFLVFSGSVFFCVDVDASRESLGDLRDLADDFVASSARGKVCDEKNSETSLTALYVFAIIFTCAIGVSWIIVLLANRGNVDISNKAKGRACIIRAVSTIAIMFTIIMYFYGPKKTACYVYSPDREFAMYTSSLLAICGLAALSDIRDLVAF